MENPKFFIGIELQHAWRLYTIAVLDAKLKLMALRQEKLSEVLAYVGELESALIAINAPPQPNQGRMLREEIRAGLFATLPNNHSADLRQVEYELILRGCPLPRTPASISACSAWMRRGFRLYRELAEIGYMPFENPQAAQAFLETSSEAIFTCMLEREPFAADSIQGRIQRQLILWDNHLPVRDPMIFFEEVTRHKLLHGILPDQDILPLAQLNALAAAFTAYLATSHPDQITRFGEPEEGFVFLPNPQKSSSSF